MSLEIPLLRQIIEGALLAAGQPLSIDKLLSLFGSEETTPDEARPSKEEILNALEDIQADCYGRGFELIEVGSGWRFQVRKDLAHWVNRLWDEKPQKYSRALLETLALIAYRQPITRGDIEEIRGVAVSSQIMKTLMERDWIKVVGHRDVPGRPSLYATTRGFLDYFNLRSLEELPTLSEIQDLDSINAELDLELENAVVAVAAANAGVDAPQVPLPEQAEAEEPAYAAQGLSEAELAEPYRGEESYDNETSDNELTSEDVYADASDKQDSLADDEDDRDLFDNPHYQNHGEDARDAGDNGSSAQDNTHSGRDSLFAPSTAASVFDESN